MPSASSPRILVGTLENGEQERHACRRALAEQSYTHWEHFTVSGLPNREAHEALYRGFMDHAAGFDLFLKLDADMVVLRRPTALEEAVAYWQARPGLGQIIFAVHDWFTDSLLEGQHLFCADAAWPDLGGPRFVDPHPEG